MDFEVGCREDLFALAVGEVSEQGGFACVIKPDAERRERDWLLLDGHFII